MCMSNKEMDRAVEMAEAENDFAVEHSSDNTADYVAGRYGYLYGHSGYPVPVRPGALVQPTGRLFPATGSGLRGKGRYDIRSASPLGGIIASLMDENSSEIAEYHIETNGLNGVEVTGRV